MYYDSGNYYEGGFLNDIYHGDDWLYVWHDGDMETSSWRDGKQYGTRVYRAVLSSGRVGAAARGGGGEEEGRCSIACTRATMQARSD